MISCPLATERNARTGLLTPPTSTFSARAKSSRERLVSRFSFCFGAVIAFDFFVFRDFLGLGIKMSCMDPIVAKVGVNGEYLNVEGTWRAGCVPRRGVQASGLKTELQ